MKNKMMVAAFATLALGGLMLSACSNDDDIAEKQNVIKPVKAPNFVLYSGSSVLGTTFTQTRGHDVNGNLWYQKWERPVNVTDEERAKVIEEFSKVRVGAKNTLQVTWNNYWVQQVYKGEAEYVDGYNQDIGAGSDHMNHLLAFNNLQVNVISWWPYEEEITTYAGDYEHINNFNNGDNQTVYTDDVTHEQFIGTTLMVNMGSDGRDEQFGYHNSTDSKDHYEYIILKIDGSYYVGFDFYATHPEGQEANKNMDVERDWVFNDWIVKISPAQILGGTPVNPNLEDDPEVDPAETDADYDVAHVEVNLSVNDKKDEGDYIATKLSIHVRDTTDVEVFIPVPAEFYCDADDMNIVLTHEVEMAYGNTLVTYNINGTIVTATVQFEADGIRVTTNGINADVLKYLRTTYGDGVTFEVWNYYNNTITREDLKPLLDQATVSFVTDPQTYVNAFATLDGTVNPWDCKVTPVSTAYATPEKGLWYNNSVYNDIYEK